MNYESCTFRTLYSFFVVQFSMTGSFSQPPFSQRLCYYITLSNLCQYLFLSFFQLFSGHILGSIVPQPCSKFFHSRKLVYYITSLSSCQYPFLKFFGFFCSFLGYWVFWAGSANLLIDHFILYVAVFAGEKPSQTPKFSPPPPLLPWLAPP